MYVIQNFRCRVATTFCLGLAFGLLAIVPTTFAQDRLIDRDAFDTLTMKGPNDTNIVWTIMPLERPVVRPENGNAKLTVVKVDEPAEKYEVVWKIVDKIELYEERVLKEAAGMMLKKDYDGAYDFFAFLLRRYPRVSGLKKAMETYLFYSAMEAKQAGRFDETMGILEDLYRQNKAFKDPRSSGTVAAELNESAEKLVKGFVAKDDVLSAQKVIRRFEKSYGVDTFPGLAAQKQLLNDRAVALRNQVIGYVRGGDLRKAFETTQEMLRVWPDVENGRVIAAEVFKRYPRVRVGVTQLAKESRSNALDNWASRRTGRLVERRLFEFLRASSTGGEYTSAFGDGELHEDYRGLTIQLSAPDNPDDTPPVTGLDLSQRLRDMATVSSTDYAPVWASIMRNVAVEDVFRVEVGLSRPHVLPHATLQMRLSGVGVGGTALSAGPFVVAESKPNQTLYTKNPKYLVSGDPPAEVVETLYDDRGLAISALKKAQVDVLDRVWPNDAINLRNEPTIAVEQYAHPTIHMLVPNYENIYLKRPAFRNAILNAIPRQALLDQLIMNKAKIPGCAVISGPFPLGTGDDDPLAYGYDTTIAPRAYDPRAAVLLKKLAETELETIYNKREEKVPKLEPLVIGHPPDQLIQIICEAIVEQLKKVNIPCTLKKLPPGVATDTTCDLVYVEVSLWEPVVDAGRLLGESEMITDSSQYLDQSLRRLSESQTWRDVRRNLLELHRWVNTEVTVIPLWQTVNFFAYRKGVKNVGLEPSTLYQNIEKWEITPTLP